MGAGRAPGLAHAGMTDSAGAEAVDSRSDFGLRVDLDSAISGEAVHFAHSSCIEEVLLLEYELGGEVPRVGVGKLAVAVLLDLAVPSASAAVQRLAVEGAVVSVVVDHHRNACQQQC